MIETISRIKFITDPPKRNRREREKGYSRKRKRCPYCLLDMTDISPKDLEEMGNICFLCRHSILDELLTIPHYRFTREQEWDLLANEMEYIWAAERVDVESYLTWMGPYYNPDYTEAKERLFGMLAEMERILPLREEFLESGGELDLLIISQLNKMAVWRGNMGARLFAGHPWRIKARRLSVASPSWRELLEFQLGLILATPWGVFGSPGEKEELAVGLEKLLVKCPEDQWDQGNKGA